MKLHEVLIKEDIKNRISESLGIKTHNVKDFAGKYNKMIRSMPYEYLAHLIRTLETYIRETKGWDFFRITCLPSKNESKCIQDLAWAKLEKEISYDIEYAPGLDDIQKRIAIAHELGHLFYCILADKELEENHEPFSSLFGIIAMLHKFQCSKDSVDYKSEYDIISNFELLQNRFDGKYNVSN